MLHHRNSESRGTCSPMTIDIHVAIASSDVEKDGAGRCHDERSRGTYDDIVSTRTSSPLRRTALPGGVVAIRRSIRRTGGLLGIAVAALLWLASVVLSWFLPGPLGGAVSFLGAVVACPVMPALGIPATGGGSRVLVAIALSAALWWLIGQLTAARVSRTPVVGYREWLLSFLVLGCAVWVGALLGVLLGAVALGAF